MQSYYIALIISVLICLCSGPVLIPLLRRLKFGQFIRSDGPATHLGKSGTPTMGGVMFFLSLGIGTLAAAPRESSVVYALLVTFGFGLIGFFDDFIKVIMKRPLGLRAREKIIAQILLSALFAYVVVVYGGIGTEVMLPGTTWSWQLGWLYIPFVAFLMVGVGNAVNLTDGLDGLAAGVTLFAALAYIFITKSLGLPHLSVFSAALLGSCLGFLFFNIYPAHLFMGDTGSLALGAAVGALAVLTKTELLLPVLGGVYVLETVSVIIQVVYFKFTGGKRFFRMSPLHHHFELSGRSEQWVVTLFWTLAAMFASLAVIIII